MAASVALGWKLGEMSASIVSHRLCCGEELIHDREVVYQHAPGALDRPTLHLQGLTRDTGWATDKVLIPSVENQPPRHIQALVEASELEDSEDDGALFRARPHVLNLVFRQLLTAYANA